MVKLLDAVAGVVCQVSPEKIQAIASRIRRTEPDKAHAALSGAVGTPAASAAIQRLVGVWRATTVSPDQLASMLLAASHVYSKAVADQSTELVWTGPTTPLVAARRTEQALLQVINAAQTSLFVTSFVAYDISSIVNALNEASNRGVSISMLLELSQDHGGSITFDALGKMKTLVPGASLYSWRDKGEPFLGGSVHAKVAVADARICFITSANLTGFAMEKNMECGVLIRGGEIPRMLAEHLRLLVEIGVVSPT